MNTTEQRDNERAALAAYLNERGLQGHEAVALLVNAAGEILGAAIEANKMDCASTEVAIEELSSVMRRAAGIRDAGQSH